MTDEAAKVINLSLHKIAEARTVRRCASLHKHLLIGKVLDKARSAYVEYLYLGENDCQSPSSPTLTPLPSISTFSGQHSNLSFDSTDSPTLDDDDDDDNDDISNADSIDPSFFVEVEGDLELPSDILNCVEKLTGDDIRFLNGEQALESTSSTMNLAQNANEMILSNLSNLVHSPPVMDEQVYVHIDSNFKEYTTASKHNQISTSLAGPISRPSKGIKRQRGWSLDESDIDNKKDLDDEGYCEEKCSFDQFLPQELNEKLKRNGVSVTKNITKRRRLSKSMSDKSDFFPNNISSVGNHIDDLIITNVEDKENNNLAQFSTCDFRIKKVQFDVDEIEEKENDEEDSFLEDDDEFDGDWSMSPNDSSESGRSKHDRRVPSGSGSSSGSDEEAESPTDDNAMEVDQITNLVQFFTFKQQQHANSTSPSCPPTSPTVSSRTSIFSESSTSTTTTAGCGLTRSISTPDLHSLQKSSDLCGKTSVKANNINDHHHLYGASFSQLPTKA